MKPQTVQIVRQSNTVLVFVHPLYPVGKALPPHNQRLPEISGSLGFAHRSKRHVFKRNRAIRG